VEEGAAETMGVDGRPGKSSTWVVEGRGIRGGRGRLGGGEWMADVTVKFSDGGGFDMGDSGTVEPPLAFWNETGSLCKREAYQSSSCAGGSVWM
jgi:hypothetical protein